MKSETVFKRKFRKKLDEIPYSWFVKISLPAVLGIPDILGVIRGRFIALELKRSSKEKPSPMQLYVLGRIKSCMGIAFVAYPENEKDILEELWSISGV